MARLFRTLGITLYRPIEDTYWQRKIVFWYWDGPRDVSLPSDWQRILFTDESCFFTIYGSQHVYHWTGEWTVAWCIQEVMPFGGASVKVCKGIWGQMRTPLIIVNRNLTVQHYIDNILQLTVLPFLQQQPCGVINQHHNARHHTARIIHNFLGANHVSVLPWPVCLPDMSPIEHLWDVTGRHVRQDNGYISHVTRQLTFSVCQSFSIYWDKGKSYMLLIWLVSLCALHVVHEDGHLIFCFTPHHFGQLWHYYRMLYGCHF